MKGLQVYIPTQAFISTMSEPPSSPGAVSPSSSSPTDYWKVALSSGETPIPAWLLSGSLVGLAAKTPTPANNVLKIRPSKYGAFGFAAAFGLGGFIIFDGDKVNGAGFNCAWSILYLMAARKGTFKQLHTIYRPGIFGLALFNSLVYGNKFFLINDSA